MTVSLPPLGGQGSGDSMFDRKARRNLLRELKGVAHPYRHNFVGLCVENNLV